MNLIKKIKTNKASTLLDVVTGMAILILFIGILTTTFFQIYKYNMSIRLNAVAVNYTIKILEDIDKMPYEDVTNELNNSLNKYNIENNFNVSLDIQNYNKDDASREDIIKIVTITMKYNGLGPEEQFTIKKLKIKER